MIDGVCVTVESLFSELTAALVFSALLDSLNGSFIPMGGTVCVCVLVRVHANSTVTIKAESTTLASQIHKWQGCFDCLFMIYQSNYCHTITRKDFKTLQL